VTKTGVYFLLNNSVYLSLFPNHYREKLHK